MNLRVCEIVQQIKYLPGYPDHWKEKLEESLNNNDKIEHWVYIIHDKDTDEDGKIKEPHIHLIMKMRDAYDVSTIGGYVGVSKNFVCKIRQKRPAGKRMVSDIGGAISYLTHRNAPGKHQYDDREVIAQPGYDWKAIRAESEAWHAQNKNFRNILTKIETGEVRRYNLMDYISMQMYLDHKPDFEKAFEYRESKLKSNTDREMNVIYIYGEPGAGKTTLAKDICDKRGYSYCLSGSSRDPVQDYGGQDALILDDLRPEAFPLSDLLKMLDNNSASSVSARYRDRWLEVKLIIITTVLSIDDFHAGYENPSEPVGQLMRRCKQMIELKRSQMYVYRYDAVSQSYRLFGQGKNPIPERYMKEAVPQEEELQKFCSDLNISYIGGQPCYEDVSDKIDTSLFTGDSRKG